MIVGIYILVSHNEKLFHRTKDTNIDLVILDQISYNYCLAYISLIKEDQSLLLVTELPELLFLLKTYENVLK